MPHLQLKFDASAWADPLAEISTEFPDDTFRVLATHLTDSGLLKLIEIETPDVTGVIRHFDDASEMLSYEVIHTDESTALIRCTYPEPEGYRAIRVSENLPRFPTRLQDGWVSTELTASHERLAAFTEELTAADIPYQIQSLTQSPDPSELLTDCQREFIIKAVERGYYEIPRDCTLIDIAESFDTNTSAASGILRRAEGRIIKNFLSESAV